MPASPPDADLFDPSLLGAGVIPADLPCRQGRFAFLWQPPSAGTLARLAAHRADVPVLVGRFDAESPVSAAGLRYWTPSDFFPVTSLIDMETAALQARLGWSGAPEPTFEGMTVIDGDLPRHQRRIEMTACVAMLLVLRRAVPGAEILTDWFGGELVRHVGLRVRRLWRTDLADRNWSVRRAIRESWSRWTNMAGHRPPTPAPASHGDRARHDDETDVVFLLGGWIEPRLLESFPVEMLARRRLRCALWVHRRGRALDALVDRTGARCEEIPYVEPAPGLEGLRQHVAGWCDYAATEGYLAPLRGPLAQCVMRLLNWPRWAPKLVAMHRLLSDRLRAVRPGLLIAPAEKDWSAYCGHHAARQLGIPSVGIPHAAWMPGSRLERTSDGGLLPSPADYRLAFTPMQTAPAVRTNRHDRARVIWQGHPRLDKAMLPPPDGEAGAPRHILVGTMGVGPGRASSMRRWILPLNIRMVEAVASNLGDRVRIRLHPWDSPDHYPPAARPLLLPAEEPLEDQLQACAGVALTYSTLALDAAAAARPVFFWDPEHLGLDRTEIARYGAAVVSHDLDELCRAMTRFLNDSTCFDMLTVRACGFPRYLKTALSGAPSRMTEHLADWLVSLIRTPKAGQTFVPTPTSFLSAIAAGV